MTANQRRPGFRLPWSSEEDGSSEGDSSASADGVATTKPEPTAATEAVKPKVEAAAAAAKPEGQAPPAGPAAAAEPAGAPVAETAPPAPVAAAPAEESDEFMRDLVAAMRAVADEARQQGVAELKTKAEEQVKTLEAEAEARREALRKAADGDIAGVGEWAATEAERIKQEAEQKVISRKARLDQELAADAGRTEAESKAVRNHVADYERELEAYHAQLSGINDPAAFAAAAKRLPKPPALGGSAAAAASAAPGETPTTSDSDTGADPVAAEPASNGVSEEAEATNAEVLASRLAELDAKLPEAGSIPKPEARSAPEATPAPEAAATPEPAPAPEVAPAVDSASSPAPVVAEKAEAGGGAPATPSANAEPAVTEVVVKGLGSFGAITGFRQSLSGVDGVESVALSLGQTGEFVFRATHGPGFDVRAAITELEGDGATIEDRPEGGLRVTLERAR